MPQPGLLGKLSDALIPNRASTQTWMVITFVFFVGIAVIAVAAYVLFILRTEVRNALNRTMFEQSRRIEFQVDQASTALDRQQVVRNVALYADMRITVAFEDSVLWDAEGSRFAIGRLLSFEPEMQTTIIDEDELQVHPNSQGEPIYYLTKRLEETGLVLRVGQKAPPLLGLVNQMRTTLIVGMIMALFLSLLGSWIAAQRVTWPLQTIRNSAKSISEGDFEEQISVDSRATEFQDLADSLNRMSDSFREKIDELQRMTHLQNEFIGNVSHEVRNPIFAVGGYLEALATTRVSEDQRQQYARKALMNLERLNTLFNDLIEIARLEYREDMLRTSVFDFAELIDEVTEMMRPKATEKGLELVSQNDEIFVIADRSRIRQVIINLVENAIAYCEDGMVTCELEPADGMVRCTVRDTGKGMAPEHLERVFERFYRVDQDRSRKGGGTGLGLSIVKQILHAHGQQIHVASRLGEGTRFWFELAMVETPIGESA